MEVNSDEKFLNALIAAVQKRPVLYNVSLADYKNKNKKGEAFKDIQDELLQAGFNAAEGELNTIVFLYLSPCFQSNASTRDGSL